MSSKFAKRFENFEQEPPKDSWNNIQTNINKKSFNWLAFSTIVGAVILVGLSAILFIPKDKTNKIQLNNNIIIEKTIPASNSNYNNREEFEANKNDVFSLEKDSKNIKETSNELADNNNSNPRYINIIDKKITTPIETSLQIKESSKVSPKKLNTNLISENNTQSNEKIDNREDIVEKEEMISNNDVKLGIEDDTISYDGLFVPSAFTPTLQDNNIFKPAYKDLKKYEINIYNRAGLLVFTSKDISMGWNGTYKGRLCEQGAYVYIIRFTNLNGENKVKKGTVALIR